MSRHRWVCPECGAGKLGSSRPRAEAAIRFCFPCSERTGYLVRRTCPALEKKRAKKRDQKRAVRQKAVAERKAERAQKREYALRVKKARRDMLHVCGLDIRKIARAVCRAYPGGRGAPKITVTALLQGTSDDVLADAEYDTWDNTQLGWLHLQIGALATPKEILRTLVTFVLWSNDAPEHKGATRAEWGRIAEWYIANKMDPKTLPPGDTWAITWALGSGVWEGSTPREMLDRVLAASGKPEALLVEIDRQMEKIR